MIGDYPALIWIIRYPPRRGVRLNALELTDSPATIAFIRFYFEPYAHSASPYFLVGHANKGCAAFLVRAAVGHSSQCFGSSECIYQQTKSGPTPTSSGYTHDGSSKSLAFFAYPRHRASSCVHHPAAAHGPSPRTRREATPPRRRPIDHHHDVDGTHRMAYERVCCGGAEVLSWSSPFHPHR